jgi:predicted RND superfamily exporter protein
MNTDTPKKSNNQESQPKTRVDRLVQATRVTYLSISQSVRYHIAVLFNLNVNIRTKSGELKIHTRKNRVHPLSQSDKVDISNQVIEAIKQAEKVLNQIPENHTQRLHIENNLMHLKKISRVSINDDTSPDTYWLRLKSFLHDFNETLSTILEASKSQ